MLSLVVPGKAVTGALRQPHCKIRNLPLPFFHLLIVEDALCRRRRRRRRQKVSLDSMQRRRRRRWVWRRRRQRRRQLGVRRHRWQQVLLLLLLSLKNNTSQPISLKPAVVNRDLIGEPSSARWQYWSLTCTGHERCLVLFWKKLHVKNQNKQLFTRDQYCHLVVKAPHHKTYLKLWKTAQAIIWDQ